LPAPSPHSACAASQAHARTHRHTRGTERASAPEAPSESRFCCCLSSTAGPRAAAVQHGSASHRRARCAAHEHFSLIGIWGSGCRARRRGSTGEDGGPEATARVRVCVPPSGTQGASHAARRCCERRVAVADGWPTRGGRAGAGRREADGAARACSSTKELPSAEQHILGHSHIAGTAAHASGNRE
jgi:hypothetical protein